MYDLVRQFNGVTTWEFSQSETDILPRTGYTGICDALCASWINYHAHNDSLANHLRQSDLGIQDVVTLNHALFLHDSFSKEPTYRGIVTWLNMHGMVSLTSDENTSDCLDTECHIVNTLAKSYACYAFVAFGVRNLALNSAHVHTVAVCLGEGPDHSRYTKGDICFFEPNFGEFWFESKQDFFGFFPMYFQLQRSWHGISAFLPEDKKAEYCYILTFALSKAAL